jgi:hypothetical protein
VDAFESRLVEHPTFLSRLLDSQAALVYIADMKAKSLRRRALALIALVISLFLTVAQSWAQDVDADAPAARVPDFSKGTWNLSLMTKFAAAYANHNDQFYTASVEGGYYFHDSMSLNIEVPFYYVDQEEGDDAVAGGVGLRFRHHFLIRDRFTLFADAGGHLFEADSRVPRRGTNFNFTTDAGVGATFRLRERLHLITGIHYFHLSNARISGKEQNPGINAVEGYVGLMFHF